jgi:hypothetical protein
MEHRDESHCRFSVRSRFLPHLLLHFLYAIEFVSILLVPKTIDTGVATPIELAVIIDLLLVSLFAIQPSSWPSCTPSLVPSWKSVIWWISSASGSLRRGIPALQEASLDAAAVAQGELTDPVNAN